MSADISTLQDASWQDKAYIGIKKKGGSSFKYFAGLAQEIDLPEQTADFDSTPVMNGGRVRENSAEEDLEFTMTIYPVGNETLDGTTRPRGINEWFLTSGDLSASGEGAKYENSLVRYDFGIAIMFSNVTDSDNITSPVQADSQIDTSTAGVTKEALRYVYKNAQITGFNPDFGDRVHTAEVTFKLAPYDEEGEANYFVQDSSDTSTDSLPAVLGSY